jgi:DNA-binding MarR family transcriptional regulator
MLKHNTPGNYELLAALVRVEIRLHNVVHRRLRAEHEVSAGQYEVLRWIQATDKCRVGDISSGLAITVGAASRTVDSLETAGWVTRTPNPDNRRSSLLEVTDQGVALLGEVSATVETELAPWLEVPLTDSDRAQLAVLLQRILTPLNEASAGQPIG